MTRAHVATAIQAPARHRRAISDFGLSRPSSRMAAAPSVSDEKAGAVQFTWTCVLKLAAKKRKNSGNENETAKFQRSSRCNQPRRMPRTADAMNKAKNKGVSTAS